MVSTEQRTVADELPENRGQLKHIPIAPWRRTQSGVRGAFFCSYGGYKLAKQQIRKLSLPGVKRFPVDGLSITVDRADASRVEAVLPRIRAVEMMPGHARSIIFLINHGTDDRPAYQPLSNYIVEAPMTEAWVLRNRVDVGDYRRANLRLAS